LFNCGELGEILAENLEKSRKISLFRWLSRRFAGTEIEFLHYICFGDKPLIGIDSERAMRRANPLPVEPGRGFRHAAYSLPLPSA